MTKDEVLARFKNAVKTVLPEVSEADITPDKSLADLGANSIDRSEIILESMMDLGVKAPLVELGAFKQIHEFVDYYHSKLNTKQ